MGTHLPLTVKEIQAGYLISPYFKDVYLYLAHNKLPLQKAVIKRTETLAARYLLLDSFLFRLNTTPRKESSFSYTQELCRQDHYLYIIRLFLQDIKVSLNIFNYK